MNRKNRSHKGLLIKLAAQGVLEDKGTMSPHFLKKINFSPELYTQPKYKQVLRQNKDSFRQNSKSLFPTFLSKEIISRYTPAKSWHKSGPWKTQDPLNSDSKPGGEWSKPLEDSHAVAQESMWS